MESSKPILPEDQGTFFIQVKEALATCEYLLHNYSKPAAIDFLKKHVALWTEVHLMLVSKVLHDFDLRDSCLLQFHDTFMELNTTVDYDGLEQDL